MRIRSIKPEFWRSDDISCLSVEDRLLFIGLWSYVDDNGVGVNSLALIAADLFASDIERDAPETFARVSRGLQNLSEAKRIVMYSVQNKDYLYITNWTKHQRIDKPNKARYPVIDADGAVIRETVASVSRDTPETYAPGTEEQGNRGTEEQRNRRTEEVPCSSIPMSDIDTDTFDDFDDFWKIYPRKQNKAKAQVAWEKATITSKKRTDPALIVAGAIRLRDDPNLPPTTFIPYASTWINGRQWEDEPLPPRSDKKRTGEKLQDLIAAMEAEPQSSYEIVDGYVTEPMFTAAEGSRS